MVKLVRAIALALLLTVAAGECQNVSAQRVALKTNAIDWLLTTPNMTLEARLSRRLSLQLGVAGCPFNKYFANLGLKHYRVEPELRYWFNRPMARHFMALSATAVGFNLRHKDRHFVGDAAGLGLSYGYALVLNRHWNMEAEAGIGLAHVKAYDYRGDVRPAQKNYSKVLPVPIRLAVSFAYIFR